MAEALREIFRHTRAAGLGIASTPAYQDDPDQLSRQAAYRLILGAINGVIDR